MYYRTGGALKTNLCLETLEVTSLEVSVHDIGDCVGDASKDPPLPEILTTLVEEDVIGQPASIVYHSCLKELANHIVVPTKECKFKDKNTHKMCSAKAPFEVLLKSRCTAVVMQWVS